MLALIWSCNFDKLLKKWDVSAGYCTILVFGLYFPHYCRTHIYGLFFSVGDNFSHCDAVLWPCILSSSSSFARAGTLVSRCMLLSSPHAGLCIWLSSLSTCVTHSLTCIQNSHMLLSGVCIITCKLKYTCVFISVCSASVAEVLNSITLLWCTVLWLNQVVYRCGSDWLNQLGNSPDCEIRWCTLVRSYEIRWFTVPIVLTRWMSSPELWDRWVYSPKLWILVVYSPVTLWNGPEIWEQMCVQPILILWNQVVYSSNLWDQVVHSPNLWNQVQVVYSPHLWDQVVYSSYL